MNHKNSGAHYSHFTNRSCEYFPCHKKSDLSGFNCLFCYCPLYVLGDDCGEDFTYTPQGIKDCSNCLLPHTESGYDYVTNNLYKVTAMMKESS